MMEVLAGVLLVLLGIYLGRKGKAVPSRQPVQPEEETITQLQEDRAAFSQLMGYSADRAYGLYDEE